MLAHAGFERPDLLPQQNVQPVLCGAGQRAGDRRAGVGARCGHMGRAVDLSAVSSLTASINKFDPTETYSAFNIYLLSAWPTINADNSYVAAVRVLGNQQATSVTLNTSGYNGSYYVLMGFGRQKFRGWRIVIISCWPL